MNYEITRLASIPSTNTYVMEQLRAGALIGAGVVVADRQTAGKGRNNKEWYSDNTLGLWATVYFAGLSGPPFFLVRRVSVAACLALRDLGVDAAIKWPNDVEAKKRKICGVLAETCAQGVAAGFGVNLRHSANDFPADIRERATSAFIETQETVANGRFLELFLDHFSANALPEPLAKLYDGMLSIKGQEMLFEGGRVRVLGVMPDGALAVQDGQGREGLFYSGSLSWPNQ